MLAAVAWWRIARPLADAWARRTRVAASTTRAAGCRSGSRATAPRAATRRGGGFVLVRFLARGLWSAARPYTITELGEGDRLRIVIRRRPQLAARLARLRPGTRAIVEGPFGDLDRVDIAPGAPVLLVGAGAGITPLRPLAVDLAADGHDVVVVHRATSAEQQLLGRRAARPRRPGGDRAARRPRRPRVADAAWLAALVPDLAGRELVVCTPPELTAGLVHAAREAGVPREQIHVGVFAL